jgi:hypothetical protein
MVRAHRKGARGARSARTRFAGESPSLPEAVDLYQLRPIHREREGSWVSDRPHNRGCYSSTPYTAFFAENQRSFDGLSKNIIEALHRMVGMVFVMHKRGSVTLGLNVFERGSVWIEQEIAIAASLQQLGHEIAAAGYIEDGIKREGLRDLLHLNPVPFVADDEVVVDFERQLRIGQFAPSPGSVGPPEPSPLLNVEARMMSPDEQRNVPELPGTNAYRLVLTLTNAGRGPAADVKVKYDRGGVEDPIVIGPGLTVNRSYLFSTYSPARTDGVPETIWITYDGLGWQGGAITLKRQPNSQPPIWRVSNTQNPSQAA